MFIQNLKANKVLSVLLVLLVLSVISVLPVFAQEIIYPEIPGAEAPSADTTLPGYVKYIFNFAIIVGGILCFAVLVFSGFFYLSSAGNPAIMSEAKSRLMSGIAGLILLLCSYLILITINPQLVIFNLPELTKPEQTEPHEYTPPEIPTTTYQEIPLGVLIENILAKNISCFDKDENLINCQSEKLIESAVTDEFSPDSHFHYCYEYDVEGNKKELLENHDRLDCVKKLSGAIEIKSEKLRVLSEELKILSENLKDKSEELKNYAHNCTCRRCAKRCRGCGCNDSSCSCSCLNNLDLCPNRAQMENLRNSEIPSIESEINIKRDEIWSFIYGANEEKYNGGEIFFYDIAMDTKKTSTFLTFTEANSRFLELKNELIQDLNYLKEAEELAKFPYGKRITLAQYLDKKIKEKIDRNLFESFDIIKYCRAFNCLSETDGICAEYELNPEGTLCNTSNLDGEPATFYFPEEKKAFAGISGKCVVDPVIETRFAEFPKGKIPIGETTDEAELFAQKIIDELEIIYFQVISEAREALLMRDEAELEIDEVRHLINLTSPGSDNTQDCVHNCTNVPCACDCICNSCGSCGCCGEDCTPCLTRYCPSCNFCSGFPCPLGSINSVYGKIENHFDNIKNYYNTLKDRPQNILNSYNRFIDLIEAKNLLPDDPNRWKIINKFLNSRVKLEECVTGYGFAIKETKTKMRVLSCEMILDKIYLGELNVLGYFEDKITPFPHCYPYNTSAVKPICEKNKDSLECREAIKDLMDNYFCCEGE